MRIQRRLPNPKPVELDSQSGDRAKSNGASETPTDIRRNLPGIHSALGRNQLALEPNGGSKDKNLQLGLLLGLLCLSSGGLNEGKDDDC